jgi:hypothetical protein
MKPPLMTTFMESIVLASAMGPLSPQTADIGRGGWHVSSVRVEVASLVMV